MKRQIWRGLALSLVGTVLLVLSELAEDGSRMALGLFGGGSTLILGGSMFAYLKMTERPTAVAEKKTDSDEA